MNTLPISIAVCLASFLVLLVILWRERISLGLPVAYLWLLLLIHVPGAFAHWVGADLLWNSDLTELGIGITAVGVVFFVVGVGLARWRKMEAPMPREANRTAYSWYCLAAGWFATYGLAMLQNIPTLGALVNKGGAIWMLGIMLGLKASFASGKPRQIATWLGALAVYPLLMLLLGGFLSYGTAAIIIVVCVLAISTRSRWRVIVTIACATVFALNVFLSYFQNRDDLREKVWGGASMSERVDVGLSMVRDFGWFDPNKQEHLAALDMRLNQNFFVGLAATRIREQQVDYLMGRSLWEGVLALVPRALWPNKPVFGGSPRIVSEMTGLELSDETSWGVGNVMEFQINFGIPGVVIGFLSLGWMLGWLDRKAALAEMTGDLGKIPIYFLPAVALIQPNGSMVEMVGGAGAALAMAHGFRWVWEAWSARQQKADWERFVPFDREA